MIITDIMFQIFIPSKKMILVLKLYMAVSPSVQLPNPWRKWLQWISNHPNIWGVNQRGLRALSYSLDVFGTCITLNSEGYFVEHDFFGGGEYGGIWLSSFGKPLIFETDNLERLYTLIPKREVKAMKNPHKPPFPPLRARHVRTSECPSATFAGFLQIPFNCILGTSREIQMFWGFLIWFGDAKFVEENEPPRCLQYRPQRRARRPPPWQVRRRRRRWRQRQSRVDGTMVGWNHHG